MGLSDKALKQAILFFGAVSFFLGKKALEGASAEPAAENDPVVRTLRKAGA
jgi:hypothetical protein